MSPTKIAPIVALAALLLLAGCSSAGKPATAPPTSAPAAATTAPSTPSPTAAATASSTGLSGTWSGQYGGSYSGTFTLDWQQSGSALSGTIKLSDPAGTAPLHGTVNGTSITFGTVGSTAITYTGSVSGNSMSGSYQVANQASGTWSASRS